MVEERDATPEERRAHVVNTGVVAAQAGALRNWLAQVRPNNSQGEFYLTDVFALAAADQAPALAVPCVDPMEAFGANDAWQLAELERYLQKRQLRELCKAGLRVAGRLGCARPRSESPPDGLSLIHISEPTRPY